MVVTGHNFLYWLKCGKVPLGDFTIPYRMSNKLAFLKRMSHYFDKIFLSWDPLEIQNRSKSGNGRLGLIESIHEE